MQNINYDRLKNARLYRGLTVEEIANKIGISKQAFSQYENNKINLPFDKIIKISNELGFPYDYFFQSGYSNNVDVKSTYFRSLMRTSKKYRNEQIIKMEFLATIYSVLDEYVEFPSLNLPKIDGDILPEDVAISLREKWDLGNKPIKDMVRVVENEGLIITKFDTPNGDIDAFSTLVELNNKNVYLIALSKNKNSASRVHFDIAHELGHILLHPWSEDIESIEREDFKKREKEANDFASAFLLPKDEFSRDVSMYPTNLNHYIELKKKWRVSIAAMIYRARQLDIITQYNFQNLFKIMNTQGILKKEPLDDTLITAEPYLLNDTIDILLDNKVFTKEELVETIKESGLSLTSREIEILLNLPEGKLKPDYGNTNNKFELKLKENKE